MLKAVSVMMMMTTMTMMRGSWIGIVLLASKARGEVCERLQKSLTYTQEEAPRDLSGVLPVVVARVNQVLEGVVNVEVGYHGDDLQGTVGEHLVKCEVTRLASVVPDDAKAHSFVDDIGRQVVSQCFEVPFTILDTNECTLPLHHPMRHKCQPPAVCVNTNGSYDCVCPRMGGGDGSTGIGLSSLGTVDEKFWLDLEAQQRGPWELSYNTSSRTSCPSVASTHGCCPVRANTKDSMTCRQNFACPKNPCAESIHDCAASATCVRKATPNIEINYECQCPQGLMGNGHKCRPRIDPKPEPKVRFDGVTPTDETIKNNYYCDCTTPVVDACSGFPPCKGKHEICVVSAPDVPHCGCKPGYVMHEKYGCVDDSPPIMKLRNDPNGDQTLLLKQGDFYKEDGVDIQDENAEEYFRSLKIAYSIPLPQGCLTKVGEFHVNYTIATPWTSPAFIRLVRRVIIEDIDECSLDLAKYKIECPELIPKCDVEAGANCVNKIGTYTCQCPKFTTGDGFLSGLLFPASNPPAGFEGGTGCHDTSKPVIELKGPYPKVFRIAKCGTLVGVMDTKKDDRDSDLKSAQQKFYGDDIKAMIRRTAGAELCATPNFPRPNASECVVAYDETYKGRVDLSKEVMVGDPVHTGNLQWRVPYNVEDAAGNKADTVWRNIVVEEVDLADIEAKVRSEVLASKNDEIRKAVDKAVAQEQRKNTASRRPAANLECPKCPVCKCPETLENTFAPSMCNSYCQKLEGTCEAKYKEQVQGYAVQFALWLENIFPSMLVTAVFVMSFVFVCYISMNLLGRLFFSPPRYNPVYDPAERERGLQNHITEYVPHPPQNGGMMGMPSPQSPGYGGLPLMNSGQGPPTVSASLHGGSAPVFSPSPRAWPQQQTLGGFQSPLGNGMAPEQQPVVDIYQPQRSPIITPNRRGDGVRYGR